jgi:hypothetical protein
MLISTILFFINILGILGFGEYLPALESRGLKRMICGEYSPFRKLGIPPLDCSSVSHSSLSPAQCVRSSLSYYPRFFLIFGRFSESCDFLPFGVSMPSLRPFSESLISIVSRR